MASLMRLQVIKESNDNKKFKFITKDLLLELKSAIKKNEQGLKGFKQYEARGHDDGFMGVLSTSAYDFLKNIDGDSRKSL